MKTIIIILSLIFGFQDGTRIAATTSLPAITEYVTLTTPTGDQFASALSNLKDGQRLYIVAPDNWTVSLSRDVTIGGRKRISVIAPRPLNVHGGQIALLNCQDGLVSGIRFRYHGDRTPSQAWKWVVDDGGWNGRGLMLLNCQDVQVDRCSFALNSDDMLSVNSGVSRRIKISRCLFAHPVGMYGQGFSALANGGEDPVHDADYVTLERCVFVRCWYRAPKLTGGWHRIAQCVLVDNWFASELVDFEGEILGCWFLPNPYMKVKPLCAPNMVLRALRLEGNWYRNIRCTDDWAQLIGHCQAGYTDPRNVVDRNLRLPADDIPAPNMDLATLTEILQLAGPTPRDELDASTIRYAQQRCGIPSPP